MKTITAFVFFQWCVVCAWAALIDRWPDVRPKIEGLIADAQQATGEWRRPTVMELSNVFHNVLMLQPPDRYRLFIRYNGLYTGVSRKQIEKSIALYTALHEGWGVPIDRQKIEARVLATYDTTKVLYYQEWCDGASGWVREDEWLLNVQPPYPWAQWRQSHPAADPTESATHSTILRLDSRGNVLTNIDVARGLGTNWPGWVTYSTNRAFWGDWIRWFTRTPAYLKMQLTLALGRGEFGADGPVLRFDPSKATAVAEHRQWQWKVHCRPVDWFGQPAIQFAFYYGEPGQGKPPPFSTVVICTNFAFPVVLAHSETKDETETVLRHCYDTNGVPHIIWNREVKPKADVHTNDVLIEVLQVDLGEDYEAAKLRVKPYEIEIPTNYVVVRELGGKRVVIHDPYGVATNMVGGDSVLLKKRLERRLHTSKYKPVVWFVCANLFLAFVVIRLLRSQRRSHPPGDSLSS